MAENTLVTLHDQPKCTTCNIIETAERRLFLCSRCKNSKYCSKYKIVWESTTIASIYWSCFQARPAKEQAGQPIRMRAKRKTISSKLISSQEISQIRLFPVRYLVRLTLPSRHSTWRYKLHLDGQPHTPTISKLKIPMRSLSQSMHLLQNQLAWVSHNWRIKRL